MMTRKAVFAAAMLALITGAAAAQGSAPQPVRDIQRASGPGNAIFQQQCAPCHGTGRGDDGSPMLPGTAALAAKYGAERPAQLELRSDLSVAVLEFFVRRGSGAMPMFRKAELTDEEMTAIADYLRETSALNKVE